jgi:hypothetical protein
VVRSSVGSPGLRVLNLRSGRLSAMTDRVLRVFLMASTRD